MKAFVKKIISFINKYLLIFNSANFCINTNSFFRFHLNAPKNTELHFKYTSFEKSRIEIYGAENTINMTSALMSCSTIRVEGIGNKIVIESGVKLRNTHIIIKGNNCLIQVGKNTTFGGIRIINAGEHNTITIGEDCLFADYIELWASDTHAIFDENNRLLNKEKPVIIGNKVWVGSKVIILKGITINDGSIVGMGSLVVNDIPEKSISVGNPNKTIKSGISWKL